MLKYFETKIFEQKIPTLIVKIYNSLRGKNKIYGLNFLIKNLLLLILNISIISPSYANKPSIKFLKHTAVPDEIIFFDQEQNQYSLDQFEGKTILLVFWATWCSACIQEIPNLDILQKDFRKLPFQIIPISEDYQGVEVVQKHFKSYQIRYLPIYHDYKQRLFNAFSIVGLPTSILIDPDGKQVVSFIGNTNWHDEKIREIILSYIPGNPAEPKNTYNGPLLNMKSKSQKSIQNESDKTVKTEKKK